MKKLKLLFDKHKNYTFNEIVEIVEKNRMTTIDCLKDENMISIEGYDGQCLSGENLFEFDKISENNFKLRWVEPYYRNMIEPDKF